MPDSASYTVVVSQALLAGDESSARLWPRDKRRPSPIVIARSVSAEAISVVGVCGREGLPCGQLRLRRRSLP